MADKPLTKEELADRIKKLQPYLLQGQSLKKACINAKVPITSTYDYYNSDIEFMNQIDEIMQNVNRIYYQANYQKILVIGNKISKAAKIYNMFIEGNITEEEYLSQSSKWELTKQESKYWTWLAEHHPNLKEDFASRSELAGPNGTELIPKDLAQPKVIETALRALEFLIKKTKEPQV